MSTNKISFMLPQDLIDELTDEAEEKGIERALYIRALLDKRHEKVINIVASSDNKFIAKLEGKLEVMGEQLAVA